MNATSDIHFAMVDYIVNVFSLKAGIGYPSLSVNLSAFWLSCRRQPIPVVQTSSAKICSQSAFYKRDARVELFRYNPNYPETGLKTVIIRGKE
jgi:hypothetical protein